MNYKRTHSLPSSHLILTFIFIISLFLVSFFFLYLGILERQCTHIKQLPSNEHLLRLHEYHSVVCDPLLAPITVSSSYLGFPPIWDPSELFYILTFVHILGLKDVTVTLNEFGKVNCTGNSILQATVPVLYPLCHSKCSFSR